MKRLIVWGAGELGGRVARLWVAAGGRAIGLTQTARRHPLLQEMGVTPHLGSPVERLQPDDCLLLSLPGHATQHEAVHTLAQTQVARPARVVMTSTTGYYGQLRGVINEYTLPGSDERAAEIAATEQAFKEWAGPNGVILRLGGLYGPGRGPFAALARRGTVRIRPPDRPLALIHYDDAAAAIFAALNHAEPEPVYLAVTPPCPPRAQFYRLACARLNLPPPEFAEPLGFPLATFDVARLRRDLLPEPAFPNWLTALSLPTST